MFQVKEWAELSGIPDIEEEPAIRKKLIDSLSEGEYSIGLSTSFQCLSDILCDSNIDGFETPAFLIKDYLKNLLLDGIKIACFESAMVFPCTGCSILCIDYNSLNFDTPFIIGVADMISLQSETYSLLRSNVKSQVAKSCIEAVLTGKIEQGISTLRRLIFSGSQLKHICDQNTYLDFLSVFDAITCRLLLDSNITEQAEPDVSKLKTYMANKKDFQALCTDILLQRGKIIKINGQINTKMYALLDYIQYTQNNL